MYFLIDYKFVFVYKASLLSREVGGGSNPLRGPSISASRLCEGGDTYSPEGQSWMVMLALNKFVLVLNSFKVGKMLANHIQNFIY